MSEFHQDLAYSASSLRLRERIARAFGRSAMHYDKHAELQRKVVEHLLTLLPATGDWQQVLDLGCGTGYCAQKIHELLPHASLIALDLAEPMLAMARQRKGVQNSSLLCGNAAALPLQAHSLDLVVSSLMLQWCGNPAVVFAELARALRPGGLALISTFGPATLQELRDAWAEVDSVRHSNEFATSAELQQAATVAGFDVALQAETQVRHYTSLQALAHELKGLGANVVSKAGPATTPAAFKAAAAAFASKREIQGIPVHWEVLCLVLRKPVMAARA